MRLPQDWQFYKSPSLLSVVLLVKVMQAGAGVRACACVLCMPLFLPPPCITWSVRVNAWPFALLLLVACSAACIAAAGVPGVAGDNAGQNTAQGAACASCNESLHTKVAKHSG